MFLSDDMLTDAIATTRLSRLTTLDFVPEGTQSAATLLETLAETVCTQLPFLSSRGKLLQMLQP